MNPIPTTPDATAGPTPIVDSAPKHYRYRSTESGAVYEKFMDCCHRCETLEYIDADFARSLERRLSVAVEENLEINKHHDQQTEFWYNRNNEQVQEAVALRTELSALARKQSLMDIGEKPLLDEIAALRAELDERKVDLTKETELLNMATSAAEKLSSRLAAAQSREGRHVAALEYVQPILEVIGRLGRCAEGGEQTGNKVHVWEAEKIIKAALSSPPEPESEEGRP